MDHGNGALPGCRRLPGRPAGPAAKPGQSSRRDRVRPEESTARGAAADVRHMPAAPGAAPLRRADLGSNRGRFRTDLVEVPSVWRQRGHSPVGGDALGPDARGTEVGSAEGMPAPSRWATGGASPQSMSTLTTGSVGPSSAPTAPAWPGSSSRSLRRTPPEPATCSCALPLRSAVIAAPPSRPACSASPAHSITSRSTRRRARWSWSSASPSGATPRPSSRNGCRPRRSPVGRMARGSRPSHRSASGTATGTVSPPRPALGRTGDHTPSGIFEV